MKKTLDFVRGAVATKDLCPVLTHFHIYDGRIQGTNGRLTIDAPWGAFKGLNFTVPAVPFLKAIDAAKGEPIFNFAEGAMFVMKGPFKCRLPLADHDEFPRQSPAGVEGELLAGELLPALRILRPFVAEDASRPWACGVLFQDGYAFATNNIVAARIPAVKFPTPINLPAFLVDELLRIGKEPVVVQATSDNITMTFEDGSWIKSQLLAATWPNINALLEGEVTGVTVSADLIIGVETVLPFCPDPKNPIIYLNESGISTKEGDKSAVVSGFELPTCCFRAEPLLAVLRDSIEVDFAAYPAPCPFRGENGLRGIMIGVRV